MMNSGKFFRNNFPVLSGMFIFLLFIIGGFHVAYAQTSNLPSVGPDQMPTEMTLWQTLKAGGGGHGCHWVPLCYRRCHHYL